MQEFATSNTQAALEIGAIVGHISGATGMVGKLVDLQDGWAFVDLGEGWLKPQRYLAHHVVPVDSAEYRRIISLVAGTPEHLDHYRMIRRGVKAARRASRG